MRDIAERISLPEAADLLRSRGIDPMVAISTLLRESGRQGGGKVWGISNPPVHPVRESYWLENPILDLSAGTIEVPHYPNRRRIHVSEPFTIMLLRAELERRWPPTNERPLQPTVKAEADFEKQLSDEVRAKSRSDGKEARRARAMIEHPQLSAKAFERVWAKVAPLEWRKPGRPRGGGFAK